MQQNAWEEPGKEATILSNGPFFSEVISQSVEEVCAHFPACLVSLECDGGNRVCGYQLEHGLC